MTARPRVPLARRFGKAARAAALGLALVAGGGAFAPSALLAQGTSMAPDEGEIDVRLKGYDKKVGGGSSSTQIWMLFVGLVLIGCVPLFKNAKRE